MIHRSKGENQRTHSDLLGPGLSGTDAPAVIMQPPNVSEGSNSRGHGRLDTFAISPARNTSRTRDAVGDLQSKRHCAVRAGVWINVSMKSKVWNVYIR